MHYAEFGEDEVGPGFAFQATGVGRSAHMLTKQKQSTALLAAIKEYDANKWKVVGQKVGKPAKVISTSARGNHDAERGRLTGDRPASSMRRNTLARGSRRIALSMDNTICIVTDS
jgi:hypothetical protein